LPSIDFSLFGGEARAKEEDNPSLIQFVASQAKICKAVLSVCTGTYILYAPA
jgi:putative intracellular protease/amidase